MRDALGVVFRANLSPTTSQRDWFSSSPSVSLLLESRPVASKLTFVEALLTLSGLQVVRILVVLGR